MSSEMSLEPLSIKSRAHSLLPMPLFPRRRTPLRRVEGYAVLFAGFEELFVGREVAGDYEAGDVLGHEAPGDVLFLGGF